MYVPDEHGNTILDSSHAGYGGGGVSIPTVPVKETIWPVAGDNTAHVQAAIDKVSALPLDRSGFRGAVLLRAGLLPDGDAAQDSGERCRAARRGHGGHRHYFDRHGDWPDAAAGGGPGGGGFGGGQPTLIRIAGGSGVTVKDDTRQLVLDEHVPVGARRFTVASARGFKPGDTVIVRRIGNSDWIAAVGMNGDTPQSRWQPFDIDWDRVVTDVQGDTITIDAPITCAIEKRWGGGEILNTKIRAVSRKSASRTCAACRSSIRPCARANTATWTGRTTSPRSTTPTKLTTPTSSPSTT